MSLEKAIEHGKEHRKPYYRSGIFDRTCRPGGSCPWCRENRLHRNERRILTTEEDIEETIEDCGFRFP